MTALLIPGDALSASEIPPGSQAALLLRILAYDHKLAGRAGKTVTIAILYKEGSPESEAMQAAIGFALEELAKKSSVSGLPVRTVRLKYSTVAKLEADLGEAGASAVYVCPGLGEAIAPISKVTQRKRVLSFGEGEAGARDGLGVGLVLRASRASILVNLSAARAEGAELDAALLRISEVLR